MITNDFFISDDGYINIRLKVNTEDTLLREEIISKLGRCIHKNEPLNQLNNVTVDQMYFHNQNPLTVLKDLKTRITKEVENMFEEIISRN